MSVSKAEQLLELAEKERQRLRRHLLLAAALREILTREPIVVGGTAEEFWTKAGYHETDLDLCAPLSQKDRATLRKAGIRADRAALGAAWAGGGR